METLTLQESPKAAQFRRQLEAMTTGLDTFIRNRRESLNLTKPYSDSISEALQTQLDEAHEILKQQPLTEQEVNSHLRFYRDMKIENQGIDIGFDFGKYFAEEARV